MTRVYILDFLFNRPVNDAYDAYSLPFKEENFFRGAHGQHLKEELLPKGPIYLKVNFSDIYPCQLLKNPFNWFLVSDLMYKTLLSIEPIEHFMWPAVLIDATYKGEYFEKDGTLVSKVRHDDTFKFFGLHNSFECFDKEHSEWEPNPFAPPDKISGITKLVLKSKNGYFPPIFTMPENAYLFVTGDLKELLEKHGVKGCVFEEVEVSE